MRICMTHFAYYPTKGGAEAHLIDLCSELVNQGHDVHALVGTLEGQPVDIMQNGIHIHRRPELDIELVRKHKQHAGIDLFSPWKEFQTELYHLYRDFIDVYAIDVLHAHNFHIFLPDYAETINQLYDEGIPTLLSIHTILGDLICRNVLHDTKWDAIIAVSEHVRQDLLREYPNLDNVYTILHGTNIDLFSPAIPADKLKKELGLENKQVIFHPARMVPFKGTHVSVAAMRKVVDKYPDAVLVLTGTDEIIDWRREHDTYKNQIFESINMLGLTNNVIFKSFDYFEMANGHRMADVVIYPTSAEEPFGLVAIEAMACGRPIIATKSGGLIESIIDGVTGYLVDKDDPDQLADRILRLLDNSGLREKMGLAGRKHVVQNFSRTRMANETLDLYHKAIRLGVERKLALLSSTKTPGQEGALPYAH